MFVKQKIFDKHFIFGRLIIYLLNRKTMSTNFEEIAVSILGDCEKILDIYQDKMIDVALEYPNIEFEEQKKMALSATTLEIYPNGWDFHLYMIQAAISKQEHINYNRRVQADLKKHK